MQIRTDTERIQKTDTKPKTQPDHSKTANTQRVQLLTERLWGELRRFASWPLTRLGYTRETFTPHTDTDTLRFALRRGPSRPRGTGRALGLLEREPPRVRTPRAQYLASSE